MRVSIIGLNGQRHDRLSHARQILVPILQQRWVTLRRCLPDFAET
jgi:hypothetical protein